jgi:hypothetical protein
MAMGNINITFAIAIYLLRRYKKDVNMDHKNSPPPPPIFCEVPVSWLLGKLPNNEPNIKVFAL